MAFYPASAFHHQVSQDPAIDAIHAALDRLEVSRPVNFSGAAQPAAAPVPPPHPEGPPEPVSEELGYFHRRYGGVPYPGFLVKSAVDELRRNFELKTEEVVIATFPK
jgi:hypothetical protein